MAVDPIENYTEAWKTKNQEFILPKRTKQRFFEEGRMQAEALQSQIDEAWTVLDYGAGVSRVLRFIKAADRIAADVNPVYLQKTPEGITPALIEDLNIPLAAGVVDFVYSLMVFQHCPLEDHAKMLNEILRVLKPGRTALIQLPRKSQYYTETKFVNTYGLSDVQALVPVGVNYSIDSGSLVGYGRNGAGWGPDREYFLTITKPAPI
jgi:SAM-dependent methyltransferase